MTAKLYKFDLSPPARATMMAIDLLDVHVEINDANLLEQEHLIPEYLKVNSHNKAPVLVDGNLNITDSHAIMMYLSDAYANDDDLYPKENKKRAMVHEKLFFDTAILNPKLESVLYSIHTEGSNTITDKQIKDINEAYNYLEEFLSKTKYVAGNYLTIADLSAFATVTSLIHIVPVVCKRHVRIQAWLTDIERKPFAVRHNAPGAAEFGELIKNTLQS